MSLISDIPPEALAEAWQIIEKRRKEEKSKKLGRTIGDWGGTRPGSFGKKPGVKTYNTVVKLEINSVQKKMLMEMGDGSVDIGVQKLINEAM